MKRRKGLLCLGLALCLLLAGCVTRPAAAPAADRPRVTATPTPTATPLPSSAPSGPSLPEIEEVLAGMTLREKVGQLFFVRPDALDPDQSPAQAEDGGAPGATQMSGRLAAGLEAYPVGGIVMFAKNIVSPEQLLAFNSDLQSVSKLPLFLAVDEEGGAVARLANHPAFALPRYESAAAVGASGDPAAAEDMGRTIGAYLAQYGFHMDFAPVADVNTNPDNPVIGARAFSRDPYTAALMAGAMARGLSSQGVIPVYKHFPGHGDTSEDSHMGAAVLYRNWQHLRDVEWLPYRENDLTGCAVMVGHIAVINDVWDMTPASLSYKLVTERLRGELGFEGLVITDALAMGAIARQYDAETAAVQALLAGCDVLLMPEDLARAFEAVVSAVENGVISQQRLDESVTRVLTYKRLAGLL